MCNRMLLACFVLLSGISCLSQQPIMDSQSTSLIAKASQALTGGTTIGAFRASGDVEWANEKGTLSLEMLGPNAGRLDLSLPEGQRSFIRNDNAGNSCGVTIDEEGASHPYPRHQCWVPSAWFTPIGWLNAATESGAIISFVGPEMHNEIAALRLHVYRDFPGESPRVRALLQSITTFDLYLDANSSLPISVEFYEQPNDNAGANFPAEIQFSDYRKEANATLPYHIQRSVNSASFVDITLSDVSINGSLVPSDFQFQ